ncbi:hypothetical protein SASPL_117197 [Salvia splendens]|uniref:Uncharacterized protein n=1 Tax=Salvia splendens TaxID=180675 RepID=A0A8X8Y033_SALSN|nr:hypothetical protein SASPL_117197 [Salvia splendens]
MGAPGSHVPEGFSKLCQTTAELFCKTKFPVSRIIAWVAFAGDCKVQIGRELTGFVSVPDSDVVVGGAGWEEEAQLEYVLFGDDGLVWGERLVDCNGV